MSRAEEFGSAKNLGDETTSSVGGCQRFEELQESVHSIELSRVSRRLKRIRADMREGRVKRGPLKRSNTFADTTRLQCLVNRDPLNKSSFAGS